MKGKIQRRCVNGKTRYEGKFTTAEGRGREGRGIVEIRVEMSSFWEESVAEGSEVDSSK